MTPGIAAELDAPVAMPDTDTRELAEALQIAAPAMTCAWARALDAACAPVTALDVAGVAVPDSRTELVATTIVELDDGTGMLPPELPLLPKAVDVPVDVLAVATTRDAACAATVADEAEAIADDAAFDDAAVDTVDWPAEVPDAARFADTRADTAAVPTIAVALADRRAAPAAETVVPPADGVAAAGVVPAEASSATALASKGPYIRRPYGSTS